MASRRTRIKGIANIPQRKKAVPSTEGSISINDKLEEDEKPNIGSLIQPALIKQEDQVDDSSNRPVEKLDDHVEKQDNISEANKPNKQDDTLLSNPEESENLVNNKSITREHFISSNTPNSHTIFVDKEVKLTSLQTSNEIPTSIPKPPPLVRRKFLKPGINLNVVKQRSVIKENVETTIISENKTTLHSLRPSQAVLKEENLESIQSGNTTGSNKVVVLSEILIPKIPSSHKAARDITKLITETLDSNAQYAEMTLNEAHFSVHEVPQTTSSSVVTFAPTRKIFPETHVSDSEYPPPPPSPSKINRSRIKAIPKLSMRKTSCSASESEDETRKYGRIRNNSVCSVASTTYLEPPTPTSENAPPKEVLPVVPKKINRTEQSRKLAEARREFYKRFGANMPDKQKLKMIDLIFYNPTSNPMSQKTNHSKSEVDSDSKEKDLVEENVDDPVKQNVVEEKEKEDNDNNMPVPQIKIGPSGEIVLDEQSLIVENVEVAKQKEQIMNSQIVDGDFDTGYGIYKRAPRSVAWSKKETLRFYKALNLIGTDFTVMTQLFPKRTRRELKLKFRKEEKINRHLIDRAIMQPCMYNFADLKRELQVEEEEEAFLQKLREEDLEKARQEREAKRERKRKIKNTVVEETPTQIIAPEHSISDLPLKKRLVDMHLLNTAKIDKPPKQSKPKKKGLNISSVIEDDEDADISDMTQSDSDEEEIIPFLKPTRSGRMPKSTIKFTDPDEIPRPPKKRILKRLDNAEKAKQESIRKSQSASRDPSPSRLPPGALRTRRFSSTSSVESNSDRLVPGSVVITTQEGPDGNTEYKVFMVTPEKKLEALELESDVIARLVKEKQSAEFPISSTPEKNVTIPAVEENCKAKEDEKVS